MSTLILCDLCGWTGTPDELDVISEEVDVQPLYDGDYPVDVEEMQDSIGEPCCPQCRTTAIGDCW